MTTKISAGQFPELYASMGIDTSELGCIMLNLQLLDFGKFPGLEEDDLYFSPSQEFVQGKVADHKAHATLLFGLMKKGSLMRPLVDTVLKDWKKPASVKIESLGVFPGKEEDGTEYSCIVAHLDDKDLVEANSRLRLLPHIDTFPEFRAHMTIAYVKPEATTEWLEALSSLVGSSVKTADLNYGK